MLSEFRLAKQALAREIGYTPTTTGNHKDHRKISAFKYQLFYRENFGKQPMCIPGNIHLVQWTHLQNVIVCAKIQY